MEIVDHADLLLKSAKRCGIDISSIKEDLLLVYTSKKFKTEEVGVMVETESLCLLCTSFMEDVEVSWF